MTLHRAGSLVLIGLLLCVSAGGALAQDNGPGTPSQPGAGQAALGAGFTYQGRLDNGAPVTDTCGFQFGLWDAPGGGAQAGVTQTVSAAVTDGVFTALLNSGAEFGSGAFDGDARYLAMAVRCPDSGPYTPLAPRQPLTAAPYALYALGAPWDGLSGVPAGFADGVDDVGASNVWSLAGNAAAPGDFAGTTNNMTLTLAVSGTTAYRLVPTNGVPNLLGGAASNTISGTVTGATIGGGEFNSVRSTGATIGGGQFNIASGSYSTIAGGQFNLASGDYAYVSGSANIASGIWSTVGGTVNTVTATAAAIAGGGLNVAAGAYGTIGGGFGNVITATAPNAVIGGGATNTASGEAAAIGGGESNTASDEYTTIGGGFSGSASAGYTTVSGGYDNTASAIGATVAGGSSNIASDLRATVSGGNGNTASSDYATVAGGNANTASGVAATVAGGQSNFASGAYSFAAGRNAQAIHSGAFVWADSNSGIITSTAANQFLVRASGGVTIYTTVGATVGAALFSGASSWTVVSDRNAKANFEPVDGVAILNALAGIPIETWNYTTQEAGIRHMGPMAQDFHAAFGLGETPTGISTVDADGVALAAIQGLYTVVQAKEALLAEQQAALAEQGAALAALNERVRALEAGGTARPETEHRPISMEALPWLPWALVAGLGLLNAGGVAGYALARRRKP